MVRGEFILIPISSIVSFTKETVGDSDMVNAHSACSPRQRDSSTS